MAGKTTRTWNRKKGPLEQLQQSLCDLVLFVFVCCINGSTFKRARVTGVPKIRSTAAREEVVAVVASFFGISIAY
jgi:hypothetical protein